MNSVVIFGPTQVGKSTLAGYLVSFRLSDQEFDRRAEKLKRNIESEGINLRYAAEMILPSFISTDRDEFSRFPNSDAIGTTKRIHRVRAYLPLIEDGELSSNQSDDIELLYIDTPGTHTRLTEKYRGIFEATAGLFMMASNDLEGIEYEDIEGYPDVKGKGRIQKYIGPLMFWFASKLNTPLVVVLSKIDRAKEIQELISKARLIIHKAADRINLEITDIPVIPISILVEQQNYGHYKRKEINILEGDGDSKSLMEALNNVLSRATKATDQQAFFSSPEKIVRTSENDELAIRQAVIDGEIRPGDSISILPVKNKKGSYITEISGSVKTVREEKTKNYDVLSQGWIGGIIPKGLYSLNSRDRVELSNIKLLKTSILTKKDIEYRKGLYLQIMLRKDELSLDDILIIERMLPKEQISIIWFDKPITVSLLHRQIDEKYIIILVSPLTDMERASLGYFVLPKNCFDQKYRITLTLHNNLYYRGRMITNNSYCNGELIYIKDFTDKMFRLRVWNIDEELDEYMLARQAVTANKNEINIDEITEKNLGNEYKKVRLILKKSEVEYCDFALKYSDDGKWIGVI